MAIRERLTGLALIIVGLLSMMFIYWVAQHRDSFGVRPPTPPGLSRGMVPIGSPLDCFVPLAALGAVGIIVEGCRRLVFPDNFGPDD